MTNSHQHAINVSGSASNVEIVNNLLLGSGDVPIRNGDDIHHNIALVSANLNEYIDTDTGRLVESSPAIGAGDLESQPEHDLYNVLREGRADVGACHWEQEPPDPEPPPDVKTGKVWIGFTSPIEVRGEFAGDELEVSVEVEDAT